VKAASPVKPFQPITGSITGNDKELTVFGRILPLLSDK
jgi:hypothetical protein